MHGCKHLIAAAMVAAIAAPVAAQEASHEAPRDAAAWQIPDNDAIAALIAQRNAPRAGQGIIVGVVEPGSERVIAGGPEHGPAIGGDSVFEIGSISKVFTALILADMVNKGEVALDDPAEKYLPAGATMPERAGKKITLRDLSTHVSGLPRLAENMPLADIDDPYFDYTDDLMLDFLAHYELPRDIGAKFEYSNFAVGLLGWLLGRAAGADYDTLLRERITGPLGMRDTSVALSADQQARFVQGYDPFMRPAKPWRFVQPGAGGIRSTMDDMLKFAAAALDPQSPIGPAMKTALAVRVPGNAGYEQALGWQVGKQGAGGELLVHNGGTGAFRSVIALRPAQGIAVVALANSAAEPATTDLGLHILAGFPLAPTPAVPAPPPPPVARTEVVLPQAELERVVGRYDFGNGVQFALTLEGGKLSAQRLGGITGPVLEVFAEAPLAFFWKAVDAQIRFTTDADGTIVGAEFTQDGQTLTGKKLAP
jgi:CubicO group peptidase (beta-lactamase class C family)